MTIRYIKTKTQSQILFEEFLAGVTLPQSCCERVVSDLNDGSFKSYNITIKRVQARLNSSQILSMKGVTFVDFQYRDKEVDIPVLIRFLNMTHCKGQMFIVVNKEDLVYLPNGSKNNSSLNELVEYVSQVQKEYLKNLRKQEMVNKVKSMFTFNRMLA